MCKDGEQCGRRATPGQTAPPLCHLHLKAAQGQQNSEIVRPVDRTPEEILRKLMRDSDPTVRLRAVNAYLDHVEHRCPKCASSADETQRRTDLVAALTEDEAERLYGVIRSVTEAVYARRPELRPRWSVAEVPRGQEDDVQPMASPVDVGESAATPPVPAEDALPVPPYKVPEELYESLGLITFENGHVTHALGDDHARAILDGTISVEEAKAQHQMTLRQKEHIDHAIQHHS